MRTIIPKNAVMVPPQAACVFKGEIFDTYQWEERMFDGSPATFEMLKRSDSVEVLVVKDNMLLVQKQEQPFIGSFLSLPGGRHDHESEDELGAAKRELKEESGYICAKWRLLWAVQNYQKIESFVYTFLAFDILDQVPMALDPGEKIENIWMTLPELKKLISDETFRSSADTLLADLHEADEMLKLPEYRP